MTRHLVALLAAMFLAGCAATNEPPRQIPIGRADVLPLALDDRFEFRKVTRFLNDPRIQRPTENAMLIFERQRLMVGAVTGRDLGERLGYYFNVWWKCAEPADVTLRLEYRQENLGSFVQAKELHYKGVKGSVESNFTVIGDEYLENGRMTAWRLLLIQNRQIVGLRQSFLWN
jgi:hypothetical protein